MQIMRLKYLFSFAMSCMALIILVQGCSPIGVVIINEKQKETVLSTDVMLVDFGTLWSERTITIQPVNPNDRWSIVTARRSPWLSFSMDGGTGTSLVSVRVNRGLLAGSGSDTLLVRITQASGQMDTVLRLPITAQNNGTIRRMWSIQQFIEEQLYWASTAPQFAPLDTMSSLLIATSRIFPGSNAVSHGVIAVGMQLPLPFIDIGSGLMFGGSAQRTLTIPLLRRSFSYTNTRTGASATGSLYLPNIDVLPNSAMSVTDILGQRWGLTLSNTSAPIIQSVMNDSLLSPHAPALTTTVDTVWSTRELRLRWLPTPQQDDSIMVSLIMNTDGARLWSHITTDNQAEWIIPASETSRIIGGRNGLATLWIARYRSALAPGLSAQLRQPVRMLSHIQRGYTVVLR
jgi:hypothetical protein